MKNKNFIMAGKLGDFIHSLFALKNICESNNIKANLYIYDLGWDHGIKNSYNELIPIIQCQKYINSFNILEKSSVKDGKLEIYDQLLLDEGFIDFGSYIKSKYLYKKCWSDLYMLEFNFNMKGTYKWIEFDKIDTRFSSKVLINRSYSCLARINELFPYDEVINAYKDNIIFISTSELDFQKFSYKKGIEFYKINTIYDWFTTINSCQMMIGNLSAPISIASSLDKQRIVELPNTIDIYHWMGEELYSKNISWFLNNNMYFNSIKI